MNGDTAAPVFLSSDRLASLSDTMFGVAMTLVATTLLPSLQAQKGPVLDILLGDNGDIFSVGLSFAISARYWVAQQQRLAMTTGVTLGQTCLHLLFLFLIVLVPISTSLPNLVGSSALKSSVMIYSAHLSLIALVNLLLWIEVNRGAAAHLHLIRSFLTLPLFIAAIPVGAIRPDLALYFWIAAPVATLPARRLLRRFGR